VLCHAAFIDRRFQETGHKQEWDDSDQLRAGALVGRMSVARVGWRGREGGREG
jgi:hypothetical protein